MNENIDKVKNLIKESKNIVALTGAGISTESGIPDYRSKDGVWERFRPVYFDEFLASHDARKEYWRRKKELYKNFSIVLIGKIRFIIPAKSKFVYIMNLLLSNSQTDII